MIMNILIKMLFCILLITTVTSCSSDKIDNENPIDIDLVYSEEVKDFSNNQNFKEFLLPYSDSTADNNNFFAANIRIVKQSEFADNKFKEIFKVIEVLPKKGTGSIYTFENGNKIINDFIEQKKSEFDKIVTGAQTKMNYTSFIESIKNKKNVFIYFDEYSKSVFKDSTIYFFGKDSIKIFKDISALKQEIYRIHSESIKSTPNKMIKFTVLYNPILFEISQEEKSKVILSILSTLNSSLAKELADSIVNKINENSTIKVISSNKVQDFKLYNEKKAIYDLIYSNMTETKANNFSESRVVFNQLANELLEIRDSCKITAIIIGELKKPTIGEMHRIPEKNGVLISTDQLIKLSQMKNLCFQFYLSSNSKDFQLNKILENVFNNEKHKINFSILKKD